MRNRGSYFWGIVLVLLGGLLLAQNMGLIPPNVNVWSIFWALVLVALGISLLMRNMSPNTFQSGSVPGTVGAGTVTRQGEAVRLPLGIARRATVRFHHGAGELRIDGNAAPDELFSGTFVGGLDHQETANDDELVVDLRVPAGSLPMMGPIMPGDALNWTVGLNPNIPLILNLEVGASRSLINLRDLQVKELRVQTGASATEIDMPARAGETRASLKSGAASMVVRIPDGVSANIRARGGLSAINVNTMRFPQVASGEYRSPDYDMAANRVDLDVETGVGEFRVS